LYVHLFCSVLLLFSLPQSVAWRYGARSSPDEEVPRWSLQTAALLIPILLTPTYPRPKPAWSNHTWPCKLSNNNKKLEQIHKSQEPR
jgi:hypothetical protein